MLLTRDELITTLFRETDREQRLKTGLAVILCGLKGWDVWAKTAGNEMVVAVEQGIVERIVRVLRCYDSVGRFGDGKYCLILPGCNSFNAAGMAGRLNQDVFNRTMFIGAVELNFEACYGIAGSGGRSPLVVLRNAENALRDAEAQGAGAIVCSSYDSQPDPAMSR